MTTSITSAFPPETLRQHGLTIDEYERIKQLLGQREPTLTELGIFSVMWSEHCSYKSSRIHLKRLPTRSKRVLQGPGETQASLTSATAGRAPSNRVAQSSVIHRAVSRRNHRRRRDSARHFHHGSEAGGGDGFAKVWSNRRSICDTG